MIFVYKLIKIKFTNFILLKYICNFLVPNELHIPSIHNILIYLINKFTQFNIILINLFKLQCLLHISSYYSILDIIGILITNLLFENKKL